VGDPAPPRDRLRLLLERLGVASRADALPAQLSGGEQQRVALARALVNAPTVLLADEPTGNLDSAGTTEVLRLLREVRAVGQTVVLVTHDARVAATADRVVSMRDGRVIDEVALADRDVTAPLLDIGIG
jgi:putative ABC transport system ATP-binding protein